MTATSLGAEPRMRQIRKLTEVSRALTYAVSLDEVFELTVARATDLFEAERALLLVANDGGVLALRASRGLPAALTQDFREPMSEGLVPRLCELLDEPVERLLAVPLVVSGGIKGILAVVRPAAAVSSAEDEWLLSALADQAAVALEKTRLDEIGEFRELLIGIVGHDLRSPLSTVAMAAQLLLQREGLGEKETQLTRRITSSASLAMRLIEQLLDVTRSRLGGGIPIDPTPFDLTEVCRQVIDETELVNPDRPLRVDMRGDLTGVWDRDRLYQLIANLVGNAIQHGAPRSSVALRIDGGGPDLHIEITNRGTPIPAATLPFIFDAFRRGRKADAARKHGLGLGLFIAQQIARSHGGAIEVTSSEDDGTRFRVSLPRTSPDR